MPSRKRRLSPGSDSISPLARASPTIPPPQLSTTERRDFDAPAYRTRLQTKTTLQDLVRARCSEISTYPDYEGQSMRQAEELQKTLKGIAKYTPRSLSLHPPALSPPGPSRSSSSRPSPPDERPDYEQYLSTEPTTTGFPALSNKKVNKLPPKDQKNVRRAYRKASEAFDSLAKAHLRHVETSSTVGVGPSSGSLRTSSTGWQGRSSGYQSNLDENELAELGIKFVPHTEESLQGLSKEGLQLFVRTGTPREWTTQSLKKVEDLFNQPKYRDAIIEGPNRRGDHRLALIGVTRSYSKELHFTRTSQPSTPERAELLEELYSDPDVQKLSRHVSSIVKLWYPGIHKRYENADIKVRATAPQFRARFGIFPLFCFNYSDDEPVHCVAHTDWKNVAGGVCVVMPYGTFDHSKRHYLLFNELGIALEVPPGVAIVYPSSLLRHENTDRPPQVDLVEADSEADAWKGIGRKRGSLVWFAQANWIVSAELGQSLGEFDESPVYGDVTQLFEPPVFNCSSVQ